MKFGFYKKKETPFLVLDIGTEAVKGLVCKKENSKIIILGASSQYFERYGVFDGKDFETDVIKRAILKTIEEARQNLGAQRQNCKKWPVLLGLPSNILKGRVIWQSFERKNPKERISKGEQELIYQKWSKGAQKEISQKFAKEFGILPKDIQRVSQKIVEIRIDGYPVSRLQGYEGKNLGFKILSIFSPRYYLESTKRIFEDLQLKVLKIVHIAENLPIIWGDKKIDGIFFDVGGEATQIFLIKRGNLQQINEFEAGGKAFSQKLSETLGIDEESARILKERYANELLSPESKKRIEEIFLEEKRTWSEDLRQFLPKNVEIFLFGGGSLLPEIQEVLKENGTRVKFIFPKNLKSIKDPMKQLKSPQYIPSLLACYYA